MTIQPIVEGQAEVVTLPLMLRRLIVEAGAYTVDIGYPVRRPRALLSREDGVHEAVRLARLEPACDAILIVFDADDDCPKDLAPRVQAWAQAATPLPCYVVMPNREFEAWFLAAIESLRGTRGIRHDATSHPDPEGKRGAAEELRKRMTANRTYSKTADSAALIQALDLAEAHRRCRSFRRMVRAFGLLVNDLGVPLSQWPPAGW